MMSDVLLALELLEGQGDRVADLALIRHILRADDRGQRAHGAGIGVTRGATLLPRLRFGLSFFYDSHW